VGAQHLFLRIQYRALTALGFQFGATAREAGVRSIQVGLTAGKLSSRGIYLCFPAGALRAETLLVRDRLFQPLARCRFYPPTRLLALAFEQRPLNVRIGRREPAGGVRNRGIGGLNACLRSGDFGLSAVDASLRLLHSGILEFFLPLVVDQAALAGANRGLRLI